MQRLKISREGIILIKSFEGFRPHAVRRDDGRWVIGYGHTLSAREGGVVSEVDAELLLQYDLLPVANALNKVAGPLNQHQFDALASFAFSVGLDRFQSSDVLSRLTSGDQGEAADAIVGWTEPTPTDTPLRRRAAERALFVADPARPVALAELLSAPLPPPPVVTPTFASVEPDAGSAVEDAGEATPALATAAFMPELSGALPAFTPVETMLPDPVEPEPEAADEGPAGEPIVDDAVIGEPSGVPDLEQREEAQPLLEPVASDIAAPAEPVPPPETEEPVETTAEAKPNEAAAPVLAPTEAVPTPTPAPIHRYAAYSATVVGPLPGPPPAAWSPRASEALKSNEPVSSGAIATAAQDPAAHEFEQAEFQTPAEPAEVADPMAAAFPEVRTAENPAPFEAAISNDAPTSDGGELLVLTPLDEGSIFPSQRLVWPHAETEQDQNRPLFDDDGALRLGAHQLIRHEIASEEPRRLDWRETGLYILMGGFGLLTFGMSMAAFRRASLPSGGSEFATIAWVLAVFGFACIAVSAWNLYRKLGRPED